jgi:ABC-2 type transport system permease protein
MTTTAAPIAAPSALHRELTTRLTFPHLLRSEWIKLRSLRSTVWCLAVVVALTLGFGLLMSFAIAANVTEGTTSELGLQASYLGTSLTQLVVAVLGALVITGEYSTGMIRSTIVAVPRRLPMLAAKALVFSATILVLGFVSILITALVTSPILSPIGGAADLGAPDSWRRLAGGALYLTFIGLIALGIGTLLRNSAGAIASALALILVVPTVFAMIPADWSQSVMKYLPSVAGTELMNASTTTGTDALEPWQALLVMLGWLVVVFVPAVILLKRRDA